MISAAEAVPPFTSTTMGAPASMSPGVARRTIREANLAGHLGNTAPTPEAPSDVKAGDQLASQDFQLYEALNILKGLSLASSDGSG